MPPLPAELTPTAVALFIVTAFVAGFARGFSGFGAALIFMPVASALIGWRYHGKPKAPLSRSAGNSPSAPCCSPWGS